MEPPWLSIVTVVKDDAPGLLRTARSIAAQNLDGVEFIVIDSSDSRQEAREALSPAPSAHYSWHPPEGIYSAMNTGLGVAQGEYVHFLNAGDEFLQSNTLADLRLALSASPAQWAFGPVVIVSTQGTEVTTPPWDYTRERRGFFSRGHFPPHQGTVARRELLQAIGGFDTSFRIAADYACFLRMSEVSDPLILDQPLARFREGGTSTLQWRESFAEFHRARRLILQPRGVRGVKERWDTMVHLSRVWLYRSVVGRLPR